MKTYRIEITVNAKQLLTAIDNGNFSSGDGRILSVAGKEDNGAEGGDDSKIEIVKLRKPRRTKAQMEAARATSA